MIKVLVDGKEVEIQIRNRDGIGFYDSNTNSLEVVWEFDKNTQKEYGKGAQIHHKFTHEGVMVTSQTDKKIFDISQETWGNLAHDLWEI
jgi:hypothetical protein